jgi:hypothetical protein
MRYNCIIGGLALAVTLLSAADSEPPRAARSVHLGWVAPEGTLFYLELAVEQSTAGSYFMACGWNTEENINAGTVGSSFFLATGGATRQELELRDFLNVLPPGLTLPAPVMP